MKNYLTGVLLASASAFAESNYNQTAAEKAMTLKLTKEEEAYVKSPEYKASVVKEGSKLSALSDAHVAESVKAAETYDAPTGKQVVTDAIDYSKGVAEAKQDNK